MTIDGLESKKQELFEYLVWLYKQKNSEPF